MDGIGLYLHIPFCVKKCDYCDFSSYAGREDQWRPVMDAMKAEMAAAEGLAIGTVYIGGGTPTVLPAELLIELLAAARRHFSVAEDTEITVEANPGTVDRQKLDALHAAGVNRFGAAGRRDGQRRVVGHHRGDVLNHEYGRFRRIGHLVGAFDGGVDLRAVQ